MTSNETKNYEALYEHIKGEIESAAVAIKDTKGKNCFIECPDLGYPIFRSFLFNYGTQFLKLNFSQISFSDTKGVYRPFGKKICILTNMFNGSWNLLQTFLVVQSTSKYLPPNLDHSMNRTTFFGNQMVGRSTYFWLNSPSLDHCILKKVLL